MSEIILKQRRWSEFREFILNDEGLEVTVSDSQGRYAEFIPFEQVSLSNRTLERRQAINLIFAQISLRLSLVLLAISFIKIIDFRFFLLGLGIGALFKLIHLYDVRKYLIVDLLDRPTPLFFMNHKGQIDSVSRFLDEVYQRRNQVLRLKYFFVNKENTPEIEKQRLEWLHSEKVISKVEYEDALFELDFGFKI
jgi:hypothetical protein